ncbi:amino acid ABC transporter permease [Clostridia bacterium]|nr:amino acid ABC transporter permease [Clostridia bacterium]
MTLFDSWWQAIQERSVAGTLSFWESIYKEIYLNFISDARYLNYLRGLRVTLIVSALAALFGVALGILLALGRLSNARIGRFRYLSWISGKYINIIRGTPMLLQLLIINFGIFGSVKMDKILIGVIACGLNSAAYVAEIIRGGIQSVDKGQVEAGRSLGLTSGMTMQLIIFPQALKAALPSMCNEFITLIKETSILAYIALTELTKAADYIRSRTYSPFMPYIISGLMYLAVVTVLTKAIAVLERRLRQSDTGAGAH